MHLGDFTANEGDNLGLFLWLLRAKVDTGACTWDVQFRYAYENGTGGHTLLWVYGNTIEVNSTSWEIHEMDVQPVPSRNLQIVPISVLAATASDQWLVDIYARRTSGNGSGELNLDCLLRVPMDEGYFFERGDIGNDTLYICTSPKDEMQAVDVANGPIITESPVTEAFNFTLPPGDVNIIIAWAQNGSSDFTDTISVATGDTGGYYERWITLRGAE